MMNIRRLGRDTLQTVTDVPLFQMIRSLQNLFVLTMTAEVLSEMSAELSNYMASHFRKH